MWSRVYLMNPLHWEIVHGPCFIEWKCKKKRDKTHSNCFKRILNPSYFSANRCHEQHLYLFLLLLLPFLHHLIFPCSKSDLIPALKLWYILKMIFYPTVVIFTRNNVGFFFCKWMSANTKSLLFDFGSDLHTFFGHLGRSHDCFYLIYPKPKAQTVCWILILFAMQLYVWMCFDCFDVMYAHCWHKNNIWKKKMSELQDGKIQFRMRWEWKCFLMPMWTAAKKHNYWRYNQFDKIDYVPAKAMCLRSYSSVYAWSHIDANWRATNKKLSMSQKSLSVLPCALVRSTAVISHSYTACGPTDGL